MNSAARTDLLGADRTQELARAQYRSLKRLTALPDETTVWPTHGAGSFCSAPPGSERTSTVGAEKRANPLLAAADEDSFVSQLIASLGTYPAYFDRLGEANRRGPGVVTRTPPLTELSAEQVRTLVTDGGHVVDVRPAADYAAGHIPGSLSIPLRGQFATWLGWLLPDTAPLVFAAADGQDLSEIVWQAYKIGYERLAGRLAGGTTAWTAAGHRLATTAFVTADRTDNRPYVDVRQKSEFAAGHVPGAVNIELGALMRIAADAPEGAVVACGHGERAMTAASLLERAGHTDVAVLDGGPADYPPPTAGSLFRARRTHAREGCPASTAQTNASRRPVRLGLRENRLQFTLLVIVNICVGGLVGLERTTVPLIGSETFGLTSDLAIFSFIIAFGLTKAFTNLAAGALTSRFSRKQLLVTGWLIGIPVPFALAYAPSWAGSSRPTSCSA
ncbi:rhodanese-like domain-containing protein [Streptomyces sp. C8S0]|uniref:rhodanese-like domain-containing protein n=1 Tax=Streptomyces sp. C8S0 TaxID=2585716 RepID=UPI001D0477A2|nr:rhodanese-like domain-containing protein [Streptomyces sp. C8S0]